MTSLPNYYDVSIWLPNQIRHGNKSTWSRNWLRIACQLAYVSVVFVIWLWHSDHLPLYASERTAAVTMPYSNAVYGGYLVAEQPSLRITFGADRGNRVTVHWNETEIDSGDFFVDGDEVTIYPRSKPWASLDEPPVHIQFRNGPGGGIFVRRLSGSRTWNEWSSWRFPPLPGESMFMGRPPFNGTQSEITIFVAWCGLVPTW
jgi:hypothetical protein